jgi:hypothetical protein
MKHPGTANSARKPSPKRRKYFRRTARQKQELLERYKRGGLTQREFCRRHRVVLSTLTYWLSQSRGKSRRGTTAFVEMPPLPTAGAGPMTVIIDLGGAVRLEALPGTEVKWLGELVKALGEACSA